MAPQQSLLESTVPQQSLLQRTAGAATEHVCQTPPTICSAMPIPPPPARQLTAAPPPVLPPPAEPAATGHAGTPPVEPAARPPEQTTTAPQQSLPQSRAVGATEHVCQTPPDTCALCNNHRAPWGLCPGKERCTGAAAPRPTPKAWRRGPACKQTIGKGCLCDRGGWPQTNRKDSEAKHNTIP